MILAHNWNASAQGIGHTAQCACACTPSGSSVGLRARSKAASDTTQRRRNQKPVGIYAFSEIVTPIAPHCISYHTTSEAAMCNGLRRKTRPESTLHSCIVRASHHEMFAACAQCARIDAWPIVTCTRYVESPHWRCYVVAWPMIIILYCTRSKVLACRSVA